ncbi:hypothetical protein N6H18_11820 [Reichenbachiella agarivorans]|uniref:Uncharacterized protein n=1 Tax=Reichenbachiella agarivorans TaxID=2979464 RepID=A0ABY6CKJ9_9BACT|nr:hypothetical protein [Reichenbachiella agarivorans]UXP31037.1 hypothetical protein N6H18_11820 [Reichenbachiella agarivorans]
MKKYLLTLTTCLISLATLAQTFEFRVLANKGVNKLQKSDNSAPTFLRTGIKMNEGDALIVGTNAYIGLMHKSGQTLEIKNMGNVTVADLQSRLAKSDNTASNRYAKAVLTKSTTGSQDVNGNYREAVHRSNSTAITLMIPQTVQVFNPDVVLRWNSVGDQAYYIISVKNIFDEEIYSAETEKTHLNINLNDENLANEELITVKVIVKDNPELFSPSYGIERLPSEEQARIQNELDAVKAEIPYDSPLSKLILASFFEENNLILDAIKQYEDIIEGSPEIEDFQVLYGEFLINNGLSKL